MKTAIILVNVERSKLDKAMNEIKSIEDITEVYAVAGEYDLVAMYRADDSSKLPTLITNQMSNIPGITKTKTLISLDSVSDYDLDSLFQKK